MNFRSLPAKLVEHCLFFRGTTEGCALRKGCCLIWFNFWGSVCIGFAATVGLSLLLISRDHRCKTKRIFASARDIFTLDVPDTIARGRQTTWWRKFLKAHLQPRLNSLSRFDEVYYYIIYVCCHYFNMLHTSVIRLKQDFLQLQHTAQTSCTSSWLSFFLCYADISNTWHSITLNITVAFSPRRSTAVVRSTRVAKMEYPWILAEGVKLVSRKTTR